ncbi:hypothetical protein P171DRAFT_436684 [Karstenula rhodostoma CBS 690.94]|uniref:F-box domain-containing protein n=1 Tax=Karstenula rhodostoma CBS 690.94 TaxID=1392251 RepID=A0A9P4U6G8_9PLEO|nr:hypothetical protein P171DRAFT_436684 [Karstenula rhodostoma CBS 690.94]
MACLEPWLHHPFGQFAAEHCLEEKLPNAHGGQPFTTLWNEVVGQACRTTASSALQGDLQDLSSQTNGSPGGNDLASCLCRDRRGPYKVACRQSYPESLDPSRPSDRLGSAEPRSRMAGAMSPTAVVVLDHEVIDIEHSPEPVPPPTEGTTPTLANSDTMAQHVGLKDPEGFLRRCSGYNKKKNVRCSAIIGRNSHHVKNAHSTFLPTCYTHRDQKSYAGWCQFMQKDDERCGRLFRWTPPYFELCAEHQGHPDTPCHFMKLPLELRLEVFRHLLPSRPIGSSTSLLHIDEDPDQQQPWYHSTGPTRTGPASLGRNAYMARSSSPLDRSTMRSVFPIPLINLLLINRQIHDEVRDFLYSTVPFTVDVRKDGTFMCGRRLLEPRRADGSSHYVVGDVDKTKERFLKTFNWAAVKNYNVDILVENWKDDTNRGYHTFPWDEEVEIYDIRDYIGVVISGILSKARNLCRLNVRLGFSKFIWTQEELYTNIKTLIGPFERLRNVRQPRFLGVYEGTPQTNFMISLPVPSHAANSSIAAVGSPHLRPSTPLCSVPQLPTKAPLFICTEPEFVEYRNNWERWIASASATSLVSKPPIRAMFTELKEFYTRLAATVIDVTARSGRHAFLHRARVAREQENVEAFRHLRNELISYWEAYLEQEERKKDDMNRRLSRMLDVDVYPASWDEDHTYIVGSNSGLVPSKSSSSSQSPVITDADSWLKAAKRSRPEIANSVPCARPRTVLSQHQPQSQARTSKCEESASAQDPVIIDLAEDDQNMREMQRKENLRLRPQQRHSILVQSPTSSDDRDSPSISQTTLQPSKDQQPMALNPQLHLEAAISHRRRAELRAHRFRAIQEHRQSLARQHAQAAQSLRLAEPPQMPYYALSHEQLTAMQQIQRQIRDTPVMSPGPIQQIQTQVHASASSSASPSFSPIDELSPATRGVPMDMSYHQQPSASFYTGYAGYPIDQNLTIPNAEPAVHIYEGSSHKRAVTETGDVALVDGKRQRVDSGMGWADEGYGTQRGALETGVEATAVGEQVYQPHVSAQEPYWEFGEQAKMGWKGKGKARAEDQESGWVG